MSRVRRCAVASIAVALVAPGCTGGASLTTREALERMTVASTKLFASDGSLLANLHGEVNRDMVRLREVPGHVQDAVVAVEDQRFWDHNGVDLRSIMRALMANIRSQQTVQGGSTISQQLVKNIYFPAAQRTLGRKLTEARYALDFERRYSKRRILEMYLNTIFLGRGAYGVQAAAKAWFAKDASALTLGEGAFLAGLIHEPAIYETRAAPDVERESLVERGRARRALVLGRMLRLGMATAAQVRQATAEPLHIAPLQPNHWQHPYFVDYVLRTLGVLGARSRDDLDHRFDMLGKTPAERAAAVYERGLRIHTTLDGDLQTAAEEAVRDGLAQKPGRLSASVVSIDPRNGHVRALVGGTNYYPADCPQDVPRIQQSRECRLAKVNLALGKRGGGSGRQPGSGFKPVVLATALERGITLADRFGSSPFTLDLPADDWKVRNYEGSGGGSMSVADATVNSVNAAYARIEVDGIGEGDAIAGSRAVAEMARKLGFGFPTPDDLRDRCKDELNKTGRCTPADVVPAIALGAKEVAPIEMASAYGTIANGGVRVEPVAVTKIADRRGRTLFEAEPKRDRVLDADVANAITYALRLVLERGTGTRARLHGRPAAGKTGTSQQWRDAWFTGYVPQLVSSVWVGNPLLQRTRSGIYELESMVPSNGYGQKVVGGSYPAIIWNRLMTRGMQGEPVLGFEEVDARFLSPSGKRFDDRYGPDPEVDPGAVDPLELLARAGCAVALRDARSSAAVLATRARVRAMADRIRHRPYAARNRALIPQSCGNRVRS